MVKTIQFPDLDDEVMPNLCFVKKHRQNEITKYNFYCAEIDKKVSKELKSWLLENISKVNKKECEEYNTSESCDTWEHVNLDSIDAWDNFKEHAFNINSPNVDLPKIKSNLIAFIIYVRQDDMVIGQVRKITPSKILDRTGRFTLFLDKSSFNEIREDKGIQIDKYSDFIFKYISPENKSEGVIFEKNNFDLIFDIYEQQKRESVKVLKHCNLIETHTEKDKIMSLVKSDRTIQKMLLKPLVKEHMNEITFEDIKELKNKVQTKIAFEIDENTKQIIFPEDKEKQAIRDFVKVIGWKYSKSLDEKHIIEGTPTKMIK